MKTLKWKGALPQVQLVADGQCREVKLGETVGVSDAAAESMIASGNWEEDGPKVAPKRSKEASEN
jgi:hypothetical protein